MTIILNSLLEAKKALDTLIADKNALQKIDTAAKFLSSTLKNGGRIFSCGNGGSMCDAMHFSEELTGRYRKNRRGFSSIAISDVGHISCVANDFGYEHIFSRYLESHGREGDCLVALSTSGTSQNIINAVQSAKSIGVLTIVLTGKQNTFLEEIADITICTLAGPYADRVQELHIKILHIFIELIERELCPNLY